MEKRGGKGTGLTSFGRETSQVSLFPLVPLIRLHLTPRLHRWPLSGCCKGILSRGHEILELREGVSTASHSVEP